MISYLKGMAVGTIAQGSRMILILEVGAIAYEIQVPSRWIIIPQEVVQVFTHLAIREEQPVLYGFSSPSDRDLFRQLISVSGVGAQSAIALIDTLTAEQLVEAIITSNIKLLTKAPGVGTKTAERISLELRQKLANKYQVVNAAVPSKIHGELTEALIALGYSPEEIAKAIAILSQEMQKQTSPEELIRLAITYLSSL